MVKIMRSTQLFIHDVILTYKLILIYWGPSKDYPKGIRRISPGRNNGFATREWGLELRDKDTKTYKKENIFSFDILYACILAGPELFDASWSNKGWHILTNWICHPDWFEGSFERCIRQHGMNLGGGLTEPGAAQRRPSLASFSPNYST